MSVNQRLAAFENFIQEARAFCAANPDPEARMKRIKILLEGSVNDPTLREKLRYLTTAVFHFQPSNPLRVFLRAWWHLEEPVAAG